MTNKTGIPFACKEFDEETGNWRIWLDPTPKLDGFYHYELLQGPLDGNNVDLIVKLLNEHAEKGDRCPCGDIILADTENWPVPLCYDCYPKHLVDAIENFFNVYDKATKTPADWDSVNQRFMDALSGE